MYDSLNIYTGRYKEFIECIMKERPLNERLEYSHDHHIVPRCTFEDKSDSRIDDEDNHINLTYREHFIAHRILALENSDIHGLVYAYWRMCNGKHKVATPEEYEEGMRLFKEVDSPNKGRSPSRETREKISNTMKRRVITQEHRSKIRDSLIGIPHSKERIEKISGENHPMYGKHLTEGHKSKIAESMRGFRHSEESRKKMSDSQRGNKNNLGHHHSEETKRKISESRKRYYEERRKRDG